MTALAEPLTMDEVYPRDEANRYRIYRVRDGEQAVLGTTATPQGIGLALVTWHDEGEIIDTDSIGILDVGAGEHVNDESGLYTMPGTWIVNPYGKGGRR